MPGRAQAEAVGSILVIGVVVVTVGIAGATVLNAATSTTETPRAEVSGAVTADSIQLTHRGGASLPGSELRLLVRVNGTETTVSWANGTLSGSDDAFDSGERWTVPRSHSPAATVEVTLYHRPSNALLFETTANPRPPGAAAGDAGAVDADDSEGRVDPGVGGGSDPTATPTPEPTPAQSEFTGVRLADRTGNRGPAYTLYYDVTASDDFDEVRVSFRNEDSPDATGTETSGDARGGVEYGPEYEVGDRYTVIAEAVDDGTVVDTRTVSDVADGTDPAGDDLSEPSSPQLDGVAVYDLSKTEADFEVAYEIGDGNDPSSVRVEIENTDASYASETYTSTARRTAVTDYVAADNGGTFGDDYRITVTAFDDDGVPVDERTITDTADFSNPSNNDDLSAASSPRFDSVSVSDGSNVASDRVSYSVSYEVVDAAAFHAVDAQFFNEDSRYASDSVESTATSERNLRYRSNYGATDRYRIKVRVLDDDGVVVDRLTVTDRADGS